MEYVSAGEHVGTGVMGPIGVLDQMGGMTQVGSVRDAASLVNLAKPDMVNLHESIHLGEKDCGGFDCIHNHSQLGKKLSEMRIAAMPDTKFLFHSLENERVQLKSCGGQGVH